MPRITAKAIIKAIGCDKLSLVNGDGYWYFIYDTSGHEGVFKYETYSVMEMRLGSDIDFWVAEGKEFVEKMER